MAGPEANWKAFTMLPVSRNVNNLSREQEFACGLTHDTESRYFSADFSDHTPFLAGLPQGGQAEPSAGPCSSRCRLVA